MSVFASDRSIERQLVAPEQAHRLSKTQLTDFLFEPGFSTASQISSLSGRGVGLDVVRNQIQALQGRVTVTSVAQQGTTFTLHIPLSLTIAKLLLCQAGDRTYALLPDAIEQILIPRPEKIQQREHCKALWWGEGDETRLIPIYTLSELLSYPEQAQQLIARSAAPAVASTGMSYVLLIRYQGVLLGVEVDQMLGEQELVIRPLNSLLGTHAYIYGASILADGQLTLVLDGATLARTASEQQTDPTPAYDAEIPAEPQTDLSSSQQLSGTVGLETTAQSGQKLLVVDDSITTRQTLTLTLQKAGYQVVQAQDGREAVDQLLQHPNVQLVICDVEMPRMNGFEFLQHCQHDPALAEVPVMMLSSRSSDKHRLLAEQLGAIAYISKPYLEHKLLEMVAELLKADVLNSVSG
ncbi:MAG: response regulator [Leptolyngbyaceae cyanobacterium]